MADHKHAPQGGNGVGTAATSTASASRGGVDAAVRRGADKGRLAKSAKPSTTSPDVHGTARNAGVRCCEESERRLLEAKSDRISRFHKSLAHGADGAVELQPWNDFIEGLRAVNNAGDASVLASVNAGPRKWVNPLAGWAVDTEVSDPCSHVIPAPPALRSPEAAAEIIELYWMALLRDVPFAQWKDHPEVNDAAVELSKLPLYLRRATKNSGGSVVAGEVNKRPTNASGPSDAPDKPEGDNRYVRYSELPGAMTKLDERSVFRGGELFAGQPLRERAGPFLSQFLLQEISYGTFRIPQRQIYATPGIDYVTRLDEWEQVQNGASRNPMQNLIGTNNASQRRYLSTMRDLATYVHFDQLYEAYLNAALILVQNRYPLAPGNPYGAGPCDPYGIGHAEPGMTNGTPGGATKLNRNQDGFGTFGGPHVLSLVCEVATRALKAVWRQKWTHLRLRPEAYAGLVQHQLSVGTFGDGHAVLAQSASDGAIGRVSASSRFHHNRLLPLAFPEGSPTHPAYGAGHATVAGACVTILKAFFDEKVCVHCPVEPNADGSALLPYGGDDWSAITVGLELDKLASNIAIGRNMAGVHWRSDYTQSMLLGQRVALDVLYRQSRDYLEEYCFHFTTFGGGSVDLDHEGLRYKPAAVLGGAEVEVLAGDEHGHPNRIARGQDAGIATALLGVV